MKKLWIIFFLAILPMNALLAVKVSTLYQVELPIIAQTQDLKEDAMRTGLLQVLIKLTGDPLIDKNPLIKSSLKKADYYVQEFGYSSVTTNSSTYHIQIRYDSHSINRLLKKAGILYWGEMRPLILVWLAVTDKRNVTQVIGNEGQGRISLDIKQQGKRHGLPLIFPMMDMGEVDQVSAKAVAEMEAPILKAASKRYSPDGLLIGHIEEDDEGLQSVWELTLKNDKWKWSVSGKTTEEIVSYVIDQVSQTLAKHYVVSKLKTPKSWVQLEVSQIRKHEDLQELMYHLKQLSPVLGLELTQVSGDSVHLSILIRGTLNALKQHVALTKRLIEREDAPEDNKLVYRWVK